MTENNVNNLQEASLLIEALQWHLDHGVDEALLDEPQDRTAMPDLTKALAQNKAAPAPLKRNQPTEPDALLGGVAAIEEAQKLAAGCNSLDELKQAIQNFDGLSLKKTATNMVFADGNPNADVMVIGEAPSADDDAQGKPFAGVEGQLLDKILACIDLDRKAEEPSKGAYISSLISWRPPGNRTPTETELAISLPFIERHITLAKPKYVILCGGLGAKTILRSSDTISKLRGKFHQMSFDGHDVSLLVTYHPAYLLRTPSQKKAVWSDVLELKKKL